MKILYLSPQESTPGMATKLEEQGNQVTLWANHPGASQQGLVSGSTDNWTKEAKKADLIIFDDVDDIKPDKLHELGKPVVAGNNLFCKLENDRLYGKETFKKLGLTISDSIHFTSFKEAMEFVKKNPDKWVFKANGQASRTLGYVAKEDDGSDVIERMAFYESHLKKNKNLWDKKLGIDFVLERCVDGIEVACGAYWDGQDFCGININWEHKRLGVGNVGVATGEMGTAIMASDSTTRLFKETLGKLRPILKSFPYHTYVDLNCIVNKDNAYVLEITSRFGWPIEAGLDAMCSVNTTKRLSLLAAGKLHTLKEFWKESWGIVVVCGTYGFPYTVAFEDLGAEQPFKFDPKDIKKLYFNDVNKINNHYEATKKGEGWICNAAGVGPTLSAARERAFDVVERINLPGIIYRQDIGERAGDQLKELKKWKWI